MIERRMATAVPTAIDLTVFANRVNTARDDGCPMVLATANDGQPVADAVLGRILAIRHDLPHLRYVIAVGAGSEACLSYSELVGAASPELTPEPTSKDDICFWQYSSGTTGAPKAAVHLQHDLYLSARLYGLTSSACARTTARSASRSSLLLRTLELARAAAHLQRGGGPAPGSSGAPARLRHDPSAAADALLRRPETRTPRSSRQPTTPTRTSPRCASASRPARCCRAIQEGWTRRFGLEVLDGIGSTEVGYIFISNRPGRVRREPRARVPGYEAKIVDAESGVGDLRVKRRLDHGRLLDPARAHEAPAHG